LGNQREKTKFLSSKKAPPVVKGGLTAGVKGKTRLKKRKDGKKMGGKLEGSGPGNGVVSKGSKSKQKK